MKTFILSSAILFLSISCTKTETAIQTAVKQDTLKQKDGTTIRFEKKYASPLIFMKRDQTVYSENYKNRIRKIAEYYIAGTKRQAVVSKRDEPTSQLGFSMEENDWEGVNYTQIGIFNKSADNAVTLQWLFYEPKSQKLYEFDLMKKKLQEFK